MLKRIFLGVAALAMASISSFAQSTSPNGVRTLNPAGTFKTEGTWSLGVRAGDFIGMSRDGVVAIADNVVLCTRLLLGRLLDDTHELVTLIEGEGSRVGDTRRIEEWLSEEYPEVALEVHHGGQPLYPYLLGIE